MNATFNLDAERSVIGAMLQDEEAARKGATLTAEHFADFHLREIFLVMLELRGEKTPIDVMTVGDKLIARNSTVTPVDLLNCIRFVPTTANVDNYIDMVREAQTRRELQAIGKRLMDSSVNAMEDASAITDAARQALRNISSGKSHWMSAMELSTRTLDWLEAMNRGEVRGVKTGLPDLDWLINGLFPGEQIIIGARPAVGKSAFSLSLGLHAARAGKKVALVSREMSPESIGLRALSHLSFNAGAGRVTGSQLQRCELDPDDWIDVADCLGGMASLPIETIYTVRTVEDLWREAQHLYDTKGIDLLIVDYLQLMHSARSTSSRVEEIEVVSGAIKDMAVDLNIPIISLAQVKRSGMRIATMPIMDELKGSGAIEQDADKIIFLHRPEVEDDPTIYEDDKHTREALLARGMQYIVANVAKHRNGDVGAVALAFDPGHMTYTCISR